MANRLERAITRLERLRPESALALHMREAFVLVDTNSPDVLRQKIVIYSANELEFLYPTYAALSEDEDGQKLIQKTMDKYRGADGYLDVPNEVMSLYIDPRAHAFVTALGGISDLNDEEKRVVFPVSEAEAQILRTQALNVMLDVVRTYLGFTESEES